MEKKIIFFISLFTLLNLPCNGQSECSIYNQILNDIQSQVTKSKIVTTTPPKGHDPEDPVFIYDTIENKEILNFLIVKTKQDFNSATVKYWFSSFLNDTSLNSKSYKNENADSILNCNFDAVHRYISYKDKISFELKDFNHRNEKGEIVSYTPAKITFSIILFSGNTALAFAKTKIGTDRGEAIFGYIFKKKGCKWEIEKRNIETR